MTLVTLGASFDRTNSAHAVLSSRITGWIHAQALGILIAVISAAASTALVTDAVQAAGLGQEAVDEQGKPDKSAIEKAGEEKKSVADVADKAKADKPAEGPAADINILASKTKSEDDAKIRSDAGKTAAKKANEAGASAKTEPTFHWGPFAVLALLFLSVFPLSAIAFRRREVPHLIAQLKVDYAMLGGRLTATGDGGQNPRDLGDRWNRESYALHCAMSIFAAVVGAALFCWRPGSLLEINTQRGMQLGFLGAYVYCLNVVYRRYTTRDLQPHVYLYCAIGLIAGMVFNYVAFTAITNIASSAAAPADEFKGVGAGAAAILAFSLGYFPNLAIRWFGRISRTSVHERQRRSDALPLSLIDGMSELHESRLQDEGIDNVQNLAAADIHELVEKTPYSAQEIVEWVDQALLYLYVDPGEIDSFRRAGVRSVTDFRDIWSGFSIRYKVQSDGTVKRIPPSASVGDFDERRKSIAQQLATTEQRLDCLFLATEEGPNMDHVRTYWDNVQTASILTRDLLINQVCGGVGRALRESLREGTPLSSDDILSQVAQGLFTAAALSGTEEAVNVSAESLYGQAYLKNVLKETSEARRLYLKCIEQFPDDPVAYNDLAWLDLQTRSQKSDLRMAREFAERAVGLKAAEKAKAEQAAKLAGDLKATEQAAGHLEEAEKAGAEQAVKQAEADKLASDLAGYRDTLALAEIRLGNIAKGVDESKRAIKEWTDLGRGTDPRFLDTLVSAAAAYLPAGKAPSEADKSKAKEVLVYVDAQGYASEETRKEIAKLRTDHNLV
jgi:tetratricopeptide (TPR) repeat protein